MEYLKEGRYFPNECYVCKSTQVTIRCKCNMISYCGQDHELSDWPNHEKFCAAVMALLEKKGSSHIYEELLLVDLSTWYNTRDEIYAKLQRMLGRPLSPLEISMFLRPRICFTCRRFNKGDLINCPGCPVASFCKACNKNKSHDENCTVMKNYLNFLTTAEELSIDLRFLPSHFPFIREKVERQTLNLLTRTFETRNYLEDSSYLRVKKTDLCNFISVVSKLNVALKNIQLSFGRNTIIHIDAENYEPNMRRNYWEFLLHLNPDIKVLKIVITFRSIDIYDLPTILCNKCRAMNRKLSVDIHLMTYEDYISQKFYQKPDVLFCCKVKDEDISEKIERYVQINCPMILSTDLEETFNKAKNNLQFLSAMLRIVYTGKIKTPFNDISPENEYFIIIKPKPIKTVSQSPVTNRSSANIETNETQSVSVSQKNNSDVKDAEIREVQKQKVDDTLSSTSSSTSDDILSKSGGNNSDPEEDSNDNFEEEEEDKSDDEHNVEAVEKENVKPTDTEPLEESGQNGNTEMQDENLNLEDEAHLVTQDNTSEIQEVENGEQKSESGGSLSKSSSLSSFIIISESTAENYSNAEKVAEEKINSSEIQFLDCNSEKVAGKETKGREDSENGDNCFNTEEISKDSKPGEKTSITESSFVDLNAKQIENQKVIVQENNFVIEKNCEATVKNRDEKSQITAVNSEIFDKNGQIHSSPSFLVKHISFLENEIVGLRKQLNLSVNEVAKLQNKILELQEICSHLIEKNRLIKEASRDIDVDISSVFEKINF